MTNNNAYAKIYRLIQKLTAKRNKHMKNPYDSINELKDFVKNQAREDAVLDAGERRYQADLVKDVLRQAGLKQNVFNSLVKDYSRQVSAAR